MLQIVSAFAAARDSISWADDAINELRYAFQVFIQGDVAEIVIEFDSQTSEHVRKLRFKSPFPKVLNRKTTEALINLRHSFDQAAAAAHRVTNSRRASDPTFPWGQTPKDVEFRLKQKGFDERLRDTFMAHEPYPRADTHPGGDDIIRSLSMVANNKHTVGLGVHGYLTGVQYPTLSTGKGQLSFSMPTWDPVKNEAELVRWSGEANSDGKYEFAFQIVFNDFRFLSLWKR
ncbi:hypothetical protein [Pseudorhodobacter sp.]|uniref:hypothetical protein n=1 Tax=Pseudorhodobacter sp. TaxID=1934400 RepID=UPI002AFF44D7|nr:hypothetical protein [Pseudorhodobacter sp.]